MTVATGRRVPLNTQAPLTLPGMLSTAGHRDQSRAATVQTPWLQITANCRARHIGSSHGPKPFNLPQPRVELVPSRESAAHHLPDAADPAVVFFEDFSSSAVGKKPINW